MKRNVLVLALLAAAMVAMASDLEHRLGIQVGWDREIYRLNSPSISGKDKNELSKTPLSGGRIGLVYELADESGVGLFTAFNYAYTWHRSAWEKIPMNIGGGKTEFDGSKIEYQSYLQSHRLDLVLQPEFKFEVAGNTYLIIYTGPTFQWIVKYQAEDKFRYNDQMLDKRYYFEDGLHYNTEVMSQYYNNWNITWGLGAAFQYDIFYIRGGYDFGLVNPYKVTTFGEVTYVDEGQVKNLCEKDPKNGNHNPDDRLTRGRLDCWNVTFGVYFWQSDKYR